MNENFLKTLETDLIGCDGGDITGSVWFCGLEWATFGGEQIVATFGDRPTYEIDDGLVVPCLNQDWVDGHPEFLAWQFDQKIAKIMMTINGEVFGGIEDVRKYMRNSYLRRESGFFKLNLYPLAAKDMQEWNERHVEITACETKVDYQRHCAGRRFDLIRRLVQRHKPKTILGLGATYLDQFKVAFWGAGEIACESDGFGKKYKNDKHQFQVLSPKNKALPTLIVSPFLGRNIQSNETLRSLGKKIKDIAAGR